MSIVFLAFVVIFISLWLNKKGHMDKPVADGITVGALFQIGCYIFAFIVCWPIAVLIFIVKDLKKVLKYFKEEVTDNEA